MGIETALIGAGLSASAAAATAGVITAVGTAAAGSLVSKALAPKQKQPDTIIPITQADKPQAEKAADLAAIKNKNAMAAAAAGQLAGNDSTLLTGSQGISSSNLNLGTSTLLGQ